MFSSQKGTGIFILTAACFVVSAASRAQEIPDKSENPDSLNPDTPTQPQKKEGEVQEQSEQQAQVEEAAEQTEQQVADESETKDDYELEPYVPGMEPPPDQYDSSYQEDYEEEIPDGLPFAKGDFEPGFLFGIWGDRDVFFLTVGGSFAYYVINRLAPGIELQYATYFSDMYDYPQSFAILPFLQFVILREGGFLPFITATGGREFQWDGSSNPTKGVKATHAWIAGGGGGLYIRIWKAFFFRIQFSVLYYWYDKTKVIALDDDLFTETDSETGETIAVLDEDFKPCGPGPEQCYVYSKSDDTKDIDGEPIYFLTFGPTFFF